MGKNAHLFENHLETTSVLHDQIRCTMSCCVHPVDVQIFVFSNELISAHKVDCKRAQSWVSFPGPKIMSINEIADNQAFVIL